MKEKSHVVINNIAYIYFDTPLILLITILIKLINILIIMYNILGVLETKRKSDKLDELGVNI